MLCWKGINNFSSVSFQRNSDVGHYMLDIISRTLAISPELMARAQKEGLAAKQLLGIIENVTMIAPSFRHQDQHLVLESLKSHNFDGLSCYWLNSSPTPNNELQWFG